MGKAWWVGASREEVAKRSTGRPKEPELKKERATDMARPRVNAKQQRARDAKASSVK